MHHRSWLPRSLLLLGAGLVTFLVTLLYANWGKIPVPFTSLEHDQNLGRPFNRYLVGVPDLLVIAEPAEIDQLDAYLRLTAPRDRTPLGVVESLRHLDYNRDFALLILQGMSGGNSQVTVQQIIHQGGRVLVQADFVTPRPGEGQTGNVTDAYHLVVLAKAGFIGQQLHFELWDGWQKRKEVVAYVGEVPHAPARPTVTPVLPLELTPTPNRGVPTPPYPAPTSVAYP
jgi:hypothetical protein